VIFFVVSTAIVIAVAVPVAVIASIIGSPGSHTDGDPDRRKVDVPVDVAASVVRILKVGTTHHDGIAAGGAVVPTVIDTPGVSLQVFMPVTLVKADRMVDETAGATDVVSRELMNVANDFRRRGKTASLDGGRGGRESDAEHAGDKRERNLLHGDTS
jgi:hypothetical protein